MKSFKNKYLPSLLFIVSLTLVTYLYNYHEIISKRPQSIHKWRQSDCASIALNYYQDSMQFLKPQVHNLTSDNGTTGYSSTSEIPFLYYTVAALYKLFGYNDTIYRIVNTFIFLIGLFYLFRILHYQIKNTFWAAILTLLFFTSPVLGFYGNNFLTNSGALALSLVGWYYFIRFYSERSWRHFYIAFIIFLLAASLKITALFSVFAIIGFCILQLINFPGFSKHKSIEQAPRVILFLSIIPIIVGLWAYYASHYNQAHNSTYFSTTIFPIWSLDTNQISGVLKNIKDIWLTEYYHYSVFIMLGICLIIVAIKFKKLNFLLKYIILIILAEVIVFAALQFWTFADHDYYTINIYILPALLFIATFDYLNKNHPNLFNSRILRIAFIIITAFNIYYASTKIQGRYTGWMNDYARTRDIYTVTPYLREIGITPDDKVISIPDFSHASLYLMNQKGWTEYTETGFNRGEKIRYNQDSIGIRNSIKKGAKYLIINGIEEIYQKPYLLPFCHSMKGKYKSVLIFDLHDNSNNFSLPNKETKSIIFCNTEKLSKDGKAFLDTTGLILFKKPETQSTEYALSGLSSIKLNKSQQFGLTVKIQDIEYGESFKISVWKKKTGDANGNIIASGGSYYNNKYTITERTDNGWEKITKEFFINNEFDASELSIYLYNPEKDDVYFDDFEIIRFKKVVY